MLHQGQVVRRDAQAALAQAWTPQTPAVVSLKNATAT